MMKSGTISTVSTGDEAGLRVMNFSTGDDSTVGTGNEV